MSSKRCFIFVMCCRSEQVLIVSQGPNPPEANNVHGWSWIRKMFAEIIDYVRLRQMWEGSITIYLEYLIEVGPLLSNSDWFLLLSFLMKEVSRRNVVFVLECFLWLSPSNPTSPASQLQELRMLISCSPWFWLSCCPVTTSDLALVFSDGLLKLLLEFLSLSLLQELVFRLEEALGDKLWSSIRYLLVRWLPTWLDFRLVSDWLLLPTFMSGDSSPPLIVNLLDTSSRKLPNWLVAVS